MQRCRVLQKPVVESLVSFAVVVLDVLPGQEAQVGLTERDHSIETFLFDPLNEPFAVRVEIGLFGGSRMGCTPPLVRTSNNNTDVRGSRSCMRWRSFARLHQPDQ